MWSVSISYGSGSGTNGEEGQFLLAGLTGNLILGFGIFGLVLVGGIFLISIVMCIDCMRKRAKVDSHDDLEDDPSEDITKEEMIKELGSSAHDEEEEGDELDTVSVESLKEDTTEITPEEEVGHNDNEPAAVMIESEQEEPEEPEVKEEVDRVSIEESQEDIPNEDKLEIASLKEESADDNNDDEEKTTIQEILETPVDPKLNGITTQS